MRSIGFTSSNDSRLVTLVKFLEITDQSGAPTHLWTEMRKNPRAALAHAVQKSYADLFAHYPDAQNKDDEALRTYFSANTGLGVGAVSKMVSTFKAICRLGDFSSTVVESEEGDKEDERQVSSRASRRHVSGAHRAITDDPGNGITININIQLQVPPDGTGEIYDKFFEAMRKHLWAKFY